MRKIDNRNRHSDYRNNSQVSGWHVFYQNLHYDKAYQGYQFLTLSDVTEHAVQAGSTMYEIHGNCVMFS